MRLGTGLNNPPPAVRRDGAAIAPRPASSTKLVSNDFPVFHWRGMMPELASPMQPGATIIEIRPYRGGWQCFEGPGVES